ncbi:MAG: hypothetical protein HDS80_02595 [Bacteroidales bacterium]|nr:hypothetical protein [Bacteroidales bacterium]
MKMKDIVRQVAILVACLFSINMSVEGANPDFAYPKTVSKNASKMLSESLKNGDEEGLTRAVMQLVIANSMIEPDSIAVSVDLFKEAEKSLNNPWNPLMYLLEAQYYTSIYSSNKYVYDSRQAQSGEKSANPFEWSVQEYAGKVTQLLQRANVASKYPNLNPIKNISGILINWEGAESEGWTISDFLFFTSIRIANTYYSAGSEVIPFYPSESPYQGNTSVIRLKKFVSQLTEDWIASCRQRHAMSVYAQALVEKGMQKPYKERMSFYWEMAKRMKDSSSVLHLLAEINPSAFNHSLIIRDTEKDYYVFASEALKKYPDAPYSDAVERTLMSMRSPSVNITARQKYLTSENVECKVILKNLSTDDLSLYKLSDKYPETGRSEFPLRDAQLIKRVAVNSALSGDNIYPFSDTITLKLESLPLGNYAIVSSLEDKNLSGKRYPSMCRFAVSDINCVLANSPAASRIYVFDADGMTPIGDADVKCYSNNQARTLIASLKTSPDGYASLPEKHCQIVVSTPKGKWSSYKYQNDRPRDNKEQRRAEILTDKGICHPGDTVGFVGVLSSQIGNSLSPLKNMSVKCLLRNVNWNVVDSASLVSDRFGRVIGKLNIPKEDLLGSYFIEISELDSDNEGRNTMGQISVEVAEYKRPEFIVTLEPTSPSYKVGETVTVKGSVKTWAGMPLENVKVNFEVNTNPMYWRSQINAASFKGELTTSDKGLFTIKLPTSALRNTPYQDASYRITARATSSAGESQESEAAFFSIGDAVRLQATIPVVYDASENDVLKIKVIAKSAAGESVDRSVVYTLRNHSDEIVASGSFVTPDLEINLKNLPAALYKLDLNDELNGDIIILKDGGKVSPEGVMLWIPERSIIASEKSSEVNVRFGTDRKKGRFLCQISDMQGNSTYKWVEGNKNGIGEIKVPNPVDGERTFINVFTSDEFKSEGGLITVYPSTAADTLKVETVSFRDKIIPGRRETWTFRFRNGGKSTGEMAAMSVMTDKALNSIMPFRWNFNPLRFQYFNPVSSLSFESVGKTYSNFSPSYNNGGKRVKSVLLPSWNLYDRSLYGSYGGIRIRGGGKYYASVQSDEAVFTKAMSMDSAYMKAETAMLTGAVNGVEEQLSADSGMETMRKKENNDLEGESEETYRESEFPVAFFYPSMVTDEEGNLEISFNVPDFNTTWQFQLAGYDDSMKSVMMVRDVTASKPLMVSVHAPRFVRTGDKLAFTASVYNNSEEKIESGVKMEIFDIYTGKILASKEYETLQIGKSGTDVVFINYDVTSSFAELGVRVYARSGEYSDGEQVAVSVLPSSVPVIDSYKFYMQPGQATQSMRLPKFEKTDNVTLSFCANPIWYCLSSIAPQMNGDSENLLTLLKSYYANSVANGLTSESSELKEGLKRYFEDVDSGNGETLKSPLQERVGEKSVSLSMTPWVNNADDETRRISSLQTLLNENEMEGRIETLLTKIEQRQTSEGLMSWFPEMDGSHYMTMRMLDIFGMLNRDGYLTPDKKVTKMVERSVKYMDRYYVEQVKKNGESYSLGEMIDYLLTRGNLTLKGGSLSAISMSGEFARLQEKAVKQTIKEWKDMSIRRKAETILLLTNDETSKSLSPAVRQNTIKDILKSLEEFSTSSPEKGVWFEGLKKGRSNGDAVISTAVVMESFEAAGGDKEFISGLRQWLILQRQISEWGTDDATISAVNAILNNSADWMSVGDEVDIKLNGETLNLPKKNLLTSGIVVNLNDKNASRGELIISRKGSGPAWGAVTSQYVAPIREVKAQSVDGLKVKRNLLKLDEKSNSTTEVDENNLKVGDKVRVLITLEVSDDMSYVTVEDWRSASMEPAEQISGLKRTEAGLCYAEVRDAKTTFFYNRLPAGTFILSYDCYMTHAGDFSAGMTHVQSAYSPEFTSRSEGEEVKIAQ